MTDNTGSSLEIAPPQSAGYVISWWTYALLLMAMVVFTGATVHGVYKMRQESEAADVSSQGAVWLVVSFEREYLKFGSLLRRYANEDPNVDPDEVLDRFDILWSRIDLVQQGEHARSLQQLDSYSLAVPPLLALLQQYEDRVFEAVPARTSLPDAFLESYFALERPVHDYMVDVHIDRSWAIDRRDERIADTRLAIYATLVGTLASTLILFAIILVQVAGRQKNLNQTLAALAQSERDRKALVAAEEERSQLTADLKERNEELERYAYTVSHDFKSPLYTILGFVGYIELDLERGKTGNIQKDLRTIKGAAHTMSNLLDDILNLSKVNLAQEPVQQTSLNDVVEEALNLVLLQVTEQGIDVKIEPDMPDIHAVYNRIVEVFENLIGNAAKFMGDQEKPKIEIGASRAGDWVHCFVRDNGIGIEPKYLDRVFNLFERLESSTEGTGMGLAIVSRIVERHGGTISVESAGLGEGACLKFSLPAVGSN